MRELNFPEEEQETLQHYGVKGMKWGVRRSKAALAKGVKAGKKRKSERKSRILEKKDKRWDRDHTQAHAKIQMRAATDSKYRLDTLRLKPEYISIKNPRRALSPKSKGKKETKFRHEFGKEFEKDLNKYADMIGKNPSKTKKLKYTVDKNAPTKKPSVEVVNIDKKLKQSINLNDILHEYDLGNSLLHSEELE